MTTGIVITIGCLALAAATIWVGSYCLPKRNKPRHHPRSGDSIQPHPEPLYHPYPLRYPNNPRRAHPDFRPVPNIPQPRYYGREWFNRVAPNPWGSTPSRFGPTQRNTTRTLYENWRKSISGLIALSERNLEYAKDHFETGDDTTAIQYARTAVENMARALIHCCGGKPDSDQGQEEALSMLSHRFKAETKAVFDKAVDKIPYLKINNKAKQTLRIAQEITLTFKKVIISNWGQEIRPRDLTTPQY